MKRWSDEVMKDGDGDGDGDCDGDVMIDDGDGDGDVMIDEEDCEVSENATQGCVW